MSGLRLLSDDDEIERAVEAAGWTFVRFGGRGMIVEGREFDVIRFSAWKGGLAAWVTVLRGEGASDASVQLVELNPTVVSAVRGAAGLKVGVDVRDSQYSIVELEKLTARPRPDGFLGYVTAISEHGWTVDRERTREDDYDFTWNILARRGEDELTFYVGFHGVTHGDRPIHVDELGGARMIENGSWWSLNVRVALPARELAEALLRR